MLNNESKIIDEIAAACKKGGKKSYEYICKEAIKKAAEYCIENGILSDFLKEHGEDVIDMYYRELMVNDVLALLNEEDPSNPI